MGRAGVTTTGKLREKNRGRLPRCVLCVCVWRVHGSSVNQRTSALRGAEAREKGCVWQAGGMALRVWTMWQRRKGLGEAGASNGAGGKTANIPIAGSAKRREQLIDPTLD